MSELSRSSRVAGGGQVEVLHVDDDRRMLSTARELIESERDRFEFVTARTPEEALSALDAGIDCVVSDYEMGGTDGLEFLDTVREQRPNVPFLLFTGADERDLVRRALSAGVTDCVRKTGSGGDFPLLADAISRAVEQDRLERELERERERHSPLFANSDNPIVHYEFTDDVPYVCDVNQAFEDVFGVSAATAAWEPVDAHIVPPEYEAEAVRLNEYIHAGGSVETEVLRETADGRRWFSLEAVPATPGEKSDRGYVVYRPLVDAEEAARRYRSLFENNPLAIRVEDFSAVKRRLDELDARVEDLGSYLQGNPDELETLTQSVDVLDVNRRAVEYYDATSKEALVENVDDLFTEETYEALGDVWLRVANGETSYRTETVERTLDGERRHHILDVVVPAEHADDYARVYVTVTDITERKRREQELQRERDRLDEFASVISHDLGNPLEIARSRLDLLSAETDSEHVDPLRRALERMTDIVDDTLRLAREGQRVGDREWVSLAELARSYWTDAETGEATLTVEEELVVHCDPTRVRHIVENLFDNAIEHGGSAVTIRLGALNAETQTDGDRTGFYVADDGPGIPPAERETVLEAGYTTVESGTGFGLTIVNRMAEAHGWDVAVTASPDGGARFEFSGAEIRLEDC